MPTRCFNIQTIPEFPVSRLYRKFGLQISGYLICTCLCLPLFGKTHHVGAGQTYTSLAQAVAVTLPGDTIMVHEGKYAGGISIARLQGTNLKWIYITPAPNATVIYAGGIAAWHMTDAAYVQVKGFIFEQQTGNGFNMDDGGTYDTPSHHIIFDACTFRNIKAKGNNDLLKLSGVDFFEIKNCVFLNGATGGSAIDMVGCHEGSITNNRFENQGSNSIQAKGGAKNIRIAFNVFKNGGQRTLNLGGSTNLKMFRPLDARYEAAQLTVYSNIIIGSDAPIAYVGCVHTEVMNNTIYLPQKWVIRILQETVDTSRFYPCGNNSFKNNIIYRNNRVSTDCNTGANTTPQSFNFSGNVWYHAQNPAWTGPVLPVKDINSIIGKDPLFNNAASGDFTLQAASPAAGKGYQNNGKL
ncbi:DUF5123 domain-containing protein [Niastella populi]|uniref:DUF5123 domain-containing protein n=1 Tax=Niastella populi TaxID=550983 RepID=UPI0009BEF18D|nr:DUF5123 domain-containing protein [Niastella populi]